MTPEDHVSEALRARVLAVAGGAALVAAMRAFAGAAR